MKRYRNKAFKFNQDIDKAYRRLFGPSNPAGCAICGEDTPELLDIHGGMTAMILGYSSCRCNSYKKYNKLEARVDR